VGLVLNAVSVVDFRIFPEATVEPAVEGVTVLEGPNGIGKTTVLEAVAFLGSLRSFRGAPRDAMIRSGCERAYVRGSLEADGRPASVEIELSTGVGEGRAQLNRQRVRRADLAAAVPVTVFSPDDLAVIQGAPAGRRRFIDDALSSLDRRTGDLIDRVERIVRQRTALLRQAAGRRSADVETTLDVWDERLAGAGSALADAREGVVVELGPLIQAAYENLADGTIAHPRVDLRYERSWQGPLAEALAVRRDEDLRRSVTGIGPHRDDIVIELDGRDIRNQASQGEQRSVVLAMRLGVHRLLTSRLGHPPLLLLDDVFSELDVKRSRGLVGQLPVGQSLLTTAVPLPPGMEVARTIDVAAVRGLR
jgi:DNA replication and repair protein RecF